MGGGPRTAAGKSVARLNRVNHGMDASTPVIPSESTAEWEAHRAGIADALAATNALEAELVDRIALLLWRLRRVVRYETAVVAIGQESVVDAIATEFDLDDPLSLLTATKETFAEQLAANGRALTVASHRLQVLNGWNNQEEDWDLASVDVIALLEAAAEQSGIDIRRVRFTGLPKGVDIDAFEGWTVDSVQQSLDAIARSARTDLADLLSDARAATDEEVRSLTTVRERLAQRMDRLRTQRILPDSATLEKITRYESHLHRQLLNTLHELEALQARRQGGVSPLARIDVAGIPSPD